jgi:hypothetical protein
VALRWFWPSWSRRVLAASNFSLVKSMPPQYPHRLEDSFVMDPARSLTARRPGAAQRLVTLLVVTFPGVLVGATTVASGSPLLKPATASGGATVPAAETRVGVAATPIRPFVGVKQPGNPAGVGKKCPRFDGSVVGSCVATKPGTVFRGDGRAAAEIFEDGMTARNPAMSIEEHLAGGNGLIASSKSKFVANGFAVQNNGLIYVIDDVGSTAVNYPKNFNFMKGEQEVFFTRIEPTQIRGAYTLKGE